MALSNLPQTTAIIEVEGKQIEDILAFCYSSNILEIGDPFSVSVANIRGKNGSLRPGQKITLRLSNDAVNGGSPTLKHTGRIIECERIADGGPTRIELMCADLGWHIRESCAPLWYNLQRGTFGDLFGENYMTVNGEERIVPFIDRHWGFQGDYSGPRGTWRAKLSTDNEDSLAARLGKKIRLNKSEAAGFNLQGILRKVYVVQVEPGDRVADLLMLHARRYNFLVNVGASGVIQIWNPDYTRPAAYSIDYHEVGERRSDRNNILSVHLRDSLEGRYSEVICVGEIAGLEFAQLNPEDPNAGKTMGTYSKPDVLPFPHRKTFCDGEMFSNSLAAKQAEWHYKRSLFESFVYEARVHQHHQDGVWWESDQLCEVNDTVNGVQTILYIQAVRYERTREGDVTHVTLRLPKLLSPSFGVLPQVNLAKVNKNLETAIAP